MKAPKTKYLYHKLCEVDIWRNSSSLEVKEQKLSVLNIENNFLHLFFLQIKKKVTYGY